LRGCARACFSAASPIRRSPKFVWLHKKLIILRSGKQNLKTGAKYILGATK
jgi:hypothetical protein